MQSLNNGDSGSSRGWRVVYYVRIVFFVRDDNDFRIEDETVLFEKDGIKCKVKLDRNLEDLKVILTYGGFRKENEAEEEGKKLLYSVKKQFAKKGIPINISGGLGVLDTKQETIDTGGFTQYGIDHIEDLFPQFKGKLIRNERLGLKIYKLEEPIAEVKFISSEAKATLIHKFPTIYTQEYKEDDKLNIAYSLLNSSNAINDRRVNFLLKVSVIECLVSEDDYKGENYCVVVDYINKNLIRTENIRDYIDIPIEELETIINKLKSTFGSIKKKSIGEKCTELINNAQLKNEYLKMDAISFFRKCYIIRSEFIHSGAYSIDKNKSENDKIHELGSYITALNDLVLDIIDYYEKSLYEC